MTAHTGRNRAIAICVIVLVSGACGRTVPRSTSTIAPPTLISTAVVSSPSRAVPTTSNFKTPPPPLPTLAGPVQDELYALLHTNGECDLPCVWGIVPNRTLWTEADALLERFALNKPLRFDQTHATPNHRTYTAQIQTNKDVDLLLAVDLDVDERDLVQSVVLDATMSRSGHEATDDTHLSWYSLSEIMRRHGRPDAVFLRPPRQGVYSIYLVYQMVKLAIGFTGRATANVTGGYTLCPNLGEGNIAEVRLAVVSPDSATDVKTLIGYPFWDTPPFEETTQMNIPTFQELMAGGRHPTCFKVP